MTSNQTGISPSLVGYSVILGIVGDIVRVQVSEEANGNGAAPCLEDLAVVAAVDGSLSLAQVIGISETWWLSRSLVGLERTMEAPAR
jgi:hypothetical protein